MHNFFKTVSSIVFTLRLVLFKLSSSLVETRLRPAFKIVELSFTCVSYRSHKIKKKTFCLLCRTNVVVSGGILVVCISIYKLIFRFIDKMALVSN